MRRDHILGSEPIEKLQEEMDYIRRVAVIANEERSKAKTKTTFNKVRAYYENHPSCTQKHVQRALNLSQYQVQNAVQKLRNQWKDK